MEKYKVGDKLEEIHARGLLASASFTTAPYTTAWGDGMLVADVALSTDETMSIYIHTSALGLLPKIDES